MHFFQKNLEWLRKRYGYSQDRLANMIGKGRGVIGTYERGISEPNLEDLVNLCKVLQVDISSFLVKDLEQLSSLPKNVNGDGPNIPTATTNVTILNLNAMASDSIDIDTNNLAMEKMYLPDIKGEHYAVRVSGDSMRPMLEAGDLVVCKKIEVEDYKDERIYLVDAKDISPSIKLLRKVTPFSESNKVELISLNASYSPREIYFHEIRQLFVAVRRITPMN